MKRITLTLSLLLLLSLVGFVFASTNLKPIEGSIGEAVIEGSEDDSDVSLEEVAIEANEDDFDDNDRVPRDSYLVINNESIGSSGRHWNQTEGYNAYRMYVTNQPLCW
ncbi:hypothetical protein SAMN05446037_101671 [Anaerovirgula multivorans]|uniref:Uncharacterized protein n=1 Tax=Anaerovirgula multivorans TaxID=312168 RepID=A0A239GG62_9FIRM|nr:hypothetical protein [Anaerovirgula multivorans]SNS67463.1 hypothetical protein SAMN05446037_101671 [Anaerovirgula multivorans]